MTTALSDQYRVQAARWIRNLVGGRDLSPGPPGAGVGGGRRGDGHHSGRHYRSETARGGSGRL